MPQIQILSKEQVEAIFKPKIDAEMLRPYLELLNSRQVGDGFTVTPEPTETARSLKRNFNTAAKQRTAMGAPAPVILRWKINSHDAEVDGKKTKVIDSMNVRIVASEAVKKRGPRKAASEAPNPNDGQPALPNAGQPSTNGTSVTGSSPVSSDAPAAPAANGKREKQAATT